MSINSTTSLGAMSAQIANFNLEKQALEEKQRIKQLQNHLLIMELFGEISSLITERKIEEMTLSSSNDTLRAEIIQLKLQHISELDTSQIKLVAKLINTKIQEIESIFQAWKKGGHYLSDKVSELEKLREKISELASAEVKDFSNDEINVSELQLTILETVVFPILNTDIISNIDPLFKEKIETLAQKLQVLENTILPIREENKRLIVQKKKIVEIHSNNLKKTLPYKQLLDEVKATHNNIVWEELVKFNRGVLSSSGALSPFKLDFYTELAIRDLLDQAILGKDMMQGVINTLETYEHLNEGKLI